MVCVAVKGVPLIGVIHRPFTDETYWSIVGHGNSANLDEMVKNRQEDSKSFRVVVSRSHAGAAKNLTRHAIGPETQISIIQAAGAGKLPIHNQHYASFIHKYYYHQSLMWMSRLQSSGSDRGQGGSLSPRDSYQEMGLVCGSSHSVRRGRDHEHDSG